jgi:hypothetical protein
METFKAIQADDTKPAAQHAQLSLNRYMNQPASLGAYRLLSNRVAMRPLETPALQPQEALIVDILKQQKGPNPMLVQPFKR